MQPGERRHPPATLSASSIQSCPTSPTDAGKKAEKSRAAYVFLAWTGRSSVNQEYTIGLTERSSRSRPLPMGVHSAVTSSRF